MNKRIIELAEQSGFQNTKFGLVATPDWSAEKFAELIVRECADIAYCKWETHELGDKLLKLFSE